MRLSPSSVLKEEPNQPELREIVGRISKSGGTPLVVADHNRVLGVIHLKDIVKGGMRERFDATEKNGHKNDHDYRG